MSIIEQAGKLGLSGDPGISRGDIDLRNLPGGHPEDMDLRQNYGDTDLRMQSNFYYFFNGGECWIFMGKKRGRCIFY